MFAIRKELVLSGALLLVLLVVAAPQAGTHNVRFNDIRAIGMGGPGVATMKDFSALMYNPAMLGKAEFGLDIISIQGRLSKDVLNLVDFIDKNKDIFDNFADSSTTDAERDQLLKDLEEFDDNPMGAGVDPKIGVVASNFAIGAYATGEVEFRIDRGIFEPRIFAYGNSDLVYSAGYGMKLPTDLISFLPNDLYVGGALKIIERRSIVYRTAASDADFDAVLDSLKENKVNGFGIDLGFLYEVMPGRLDVGMKVTDILADLGDDNPPMIINVGTSFQVMPALLLAADYNDMFMTTKQNFFNRLYLGGEYALAKVLFVRAGFAQGYPAVGAGLDFGAVRLDGAIYGVEKTTRPGGDGDYNFAGRLIIGW
jgi:hypothetical protein